MFRFSVTSWDKVLELARMYGWTPQGTAAPTVYIDGQELEELWAGGYFTNEYQTVTTPDARAIADALTAALDDVPDQQVAEYQFHESQDALGQALTSMLGPRGGHVGVFGPDPERSALTWFSGPGQKEKLRAFIAYCRAGAFCIE
jgi:hypothetical protein